VDTSALRSTKLLGQGQKIKLQQPRKGTPRDNSDTEDEPSTNSATEDDSHDSVRKNKEDGTPESSVQNTNQSVVGSALKSGFSIHGPTRTKQKSQNQVSWRERLEHSRKDIDDSDVNSSDSETSTSNDDEYSDWSGFASESERVESVVHGESVNPQSPESDDGIPHPSMQQVDVADQDQTLDDGGEHLHQRVSQFKLWAREQSGFGNTQSNLSSLPVLPPGKNEAETMASKVAKAPTETPLKELRPARVVAQSLLFLIKRHGSYE